jgi:hypothetical protein
MRTARIVRPMRMDLVKYSSFLGPAVKWRIREPVWAGIATVPRLHNCAGST